MQRIILIVVPVIVLALAGCSTDAVRTEAAKKATEANKSPQNERERGEVVPGDQSASEADREITTSLRRSVLSDDSLSVTALNIKITTIDGVVTLRGQVKDEAERALIEAKTKLVAGVKSVDNQLEIARDQ